MPAEVTTAPASHRAAAEQPVRKHRPALDGVRALAIVTVMIYHATAHWPPGGFFSVDVFFVLSGYLIAGLLISEHRRWGSIDLVAFYVRRARRLFPGLVLAVIGIAAICPLLLDDQAVSKMRGDGLATIFYVANWHFINQGDSYFAQFGDPSPYRHMWTLAIEEQFYVILPLLAVVLLKLGRGRLTVLLGWMLALAALSAIWMAVLYEPGANPARVYYGTDARAQDLLLGSSLAVVMKLIAKRGGIRPGAATALGATALAVMVSMFFLLDETDTLTYTGGFTVFVLATCALIASVESNQDGPVARLFGVTWWAWIGKISYGLYLWHWPVFVVMSPERVGFDGPALFVARFAVSFALGAASFHFVEDPIRKHGLRRWIGRRGGAVAGWLCLPLTAVLMLMLTPAVQASPQTTAETGESSVVGSIDAGADLKVLILGDSVGFAIGYAFPKDDHPGVSVVGDVIFGCGTAEQHLAVNGTPQRREEVDKCSDVFGKWRADVEANDPDVVLWSLGGWEVFDHVVDGEVLEVGGAEYADHLTSRLEEGLEELGDDVQVVIPNVPCYRQPSFVVDGDDMAPDRNDPARGEAVNEILDDFAAAHDNVHIFDVASKVCPDGKFVDEIDGVQVRDDGVHYTQQGVGLFWEWIMPTLEQVTADS